MRRIVWDVWQRLPYDVRQQLEGRVTVKAKAAGDGHIADAGRDDILLRVPLPHWKEREVVCHELCHVYLSHFDRVARGEISEAQAEAEARQLASEWGFGV